eukprot:g383.t1
MDFPQKGAFFGLLRGAILEERAARQRQKSNALRRKLISEFEDPELKAAGGEGEVSPPEVDALFLLDAPADAEELQAMSDAGLYEVVDLWTNIYFAGETLDESEPPVQVECPMGEVPQLFFQAIGSAAASTDLANCTVSVVPESHQLAALEAPQDSAEGAEAPPAVTTTPVERVTDGGPGRTSDRSIVHRLGRSSATHATEWSASVAMEERNLVMFLLIVILEVFVVLFLLWKLFRFCRTVALAQLMEILRQGLSKPFAKRKVDPRVCEKFHRIQCMLVLKGSQAFLLALFPRMIAIQGPIYRGESHSIFPALDPANIFSIFVCLLTLLGQRYITPQVLDIWFLLMHFTCAWPLLLADPTEVRTIHFVVILPAFLIGLTAKHWQLAGLGNLFSALIAAYRSPQHSFTDFFSNLALALLVLAVVFAIRTQLYQNVRMEMRLKNRSIDLEAEDSRQLSTMLLQGQGTRAGLGGRDILSFFCKARPNSLKGCEDRDHIRQSFENIHRPQMTTALNARMLDSLGNMVRVELLHIQFCNVDGEQCHLVGMREFQDVASIAPLMDDREISWENAIHEIIRKGETSLVFDAHSFDILAMSEGFQSLSQANGQGGSESLVGYSIFDVCCGSGPQSFSCRMQDAVNALDDAASSQDVFLLRKVELYAMTISTLDAEKLEDKILETLVGSVVITTEMDLRSTRHNCQKRISKSSTASGGRRRMSGLLGRTCL